MKKSNPNTKIEDAARYIDNAVEILKTKAGNGVPGYYSDAKYVKMACNTAWNGVLVALDTLVPVPSKGKRRSVDTYKEYLAARNRKILNDFVSGYNYLHLLGGYDGDLNKKTAQTGLQLAENVIEWCKRNSNQVV